MERRTYDRMRALERGHWRSGLTIQGGMLRRLFAVEKHLLKVSPLPFGVSILLIAERPR